MEIPSDKENSTEAMDTEAALDIFREPFWVEALPGRVLEAGTKQMKLQGSIPTNQPKIDVFFKKRQLNL